ncbi:MAG: UbiA family prenyltransferase [Thermoplasmatales archaeon]|nr:UbiA family prenyltransferase [Thermoplasmatales archaeon]
MMIREYLKLARSFNAVLTGVSPVMGAIAMEQYNILYLFLLFLVGFLGHTFGFVFNDIVDYKIDKYSKEISDRPLISGTISVKKAWVFAIASMVAAFIIAIYIAVTTYSFFPIVVLAISSFFIILYDLTSKKFPFTDVLVALGLFFLILYGAFYGNVPVKSIYDITKLAWIVCVLGSIQVLFMQIVAGGMKDIENDFMKGAKTLAVQMGVRIVNGNLKVSSSFKTLAYSIQSTDIIIVFLPFFIIQNFSKSPILQYFQWLILVIIAILMFFLSHKLLSMKRFERFKARKLIGSHYVTNFALVPIMLMSLNPWSGLLVFFPAVGYILSNIIVHGTILQPKTM